MKLLLSLACPAFLIITSLDILYLFIAGRWCDPKIWIQTSELVMMPVFVILGIIEIIVICREWRK